jgi:hypothetical protein
LHMHVSIHKLHNSPLCIQEVIQFPLTKIFAKVSIPFCFFYKMRQPRKGW